MFSANVASFRFKKTLYKFGDWEMFVTIFYLNSQTLFLKYGDHLTQISFEKNKKINDLEENVAQNAAALARNEEELKKYKAELERNSANVGALTKNKAKNEEELKQYKAKNEEELKKYKAELERNAANVAALTKNEENYKAELERNAAALAELKKFLEESLGKGMFKKEEANTALKGKEETKNKFGAITPILYCIESSRLEFKNSNSKHFKGLFTNYVCLQKSI